MLERKVLKLFDEQKDFLDKKVADGIEKYRKGNAKIIVTDESGNPVGNAKIFIRQKSHEFKFGANIFMLNQLETAEKNEAYEKYFANVFNMATLPFYWNSLEPEQGKPRYEKDSFEIYRRPPIDRCIDFCEKHGIEPREHALAYEQFYPQWLSGASVDEVKSATEHHFAEIAERYANKVPTVEVTNEMEWTDGVTAFYDSPDFIEWCFKTAEKYFPSNELVVNEWTEPAWMDRCRTTDKYYAYIEANMLKGARIDAIGMQYHLFYEAEQLYNDKSGLLNPKNLYRHMDLYSSLGKPLQITEVTVPSYSWNDEDEDLQAEIIEKLYSIWFSHPNVEQIIYWNLMDGYAHVPNPDPKKIKASQGNMKLGENYYHGGLLRFDMTPKPAYSRIKELTQEKWHTELETVTNKNGMTDFRGFYGEYEITVICGDRSIPKNIVLSSKSDNTIEIKI